MVDRPIIFSGPMVNALLAGRKSQTRRLLNPQPDQASDPSGEGQWGMLNRHEYWMPAAEFRPYAPGDRLYVKEAVCWVSGWGWRYRADNDDLAEKREAREVSRWRPSIHMPRWASRLTLTVTEVRVQRLQEISYLDTCAEGVDCETCAAMGQSACYRKGCGASREAFRTLWNSLHGPDAWAQNPWVVALTFTVQRGNIDQIGGAK